MTNVKYLIFFIMLHTLTYGAKIPLNNNYNIFREFQKYQNRRLIQPDFSPYNPFFYRDYKPETINFNNKLTSSQKKLTENFLYTQAFMISTVLVLWIMPESVSKWDKDALKEKSLSDRWEEHVKEGPVWDRDDWGINYIGHPVSGAWYYAAARNYGISPEGSFFYSFFLSTFIWEYGYEAFAEIPSWQDIFSTPILGSFLGEGFYYLEKKLDRNKGEVFGSKTLGNISYFLLNPLGNISDGLSNFFDIHATFKFQSYQSNLFSDQKRKYLFENRPNITDQQAYGFVLDIQY